ncbi:hypothetical protein VPHD484_0272 [Vibrio phage D484]
MSLPSNAQFFKVRPCGERVHVGNMFCNCGWFYNEDHLLSDLADEIEHSKIVNGTMKKDIEWDYLVAYGYAHSKEKVLSYLQ